MLPTVYCWGLQRFIVVKVLALQAQGSSMHPWGTWGTMVCPLGTQNTVVFPWGTWGTVVCPWGTQGTVVCPWGTWGTVVCPWGTRGTVVCLWGTRDAVVCPWGTWGTVVCTCSFQHREEETRRSLGSSVSERCCFQIYSEPWVRITLSINLWCMHM